MGKYSYVRSLFPDDVVRRLLPPPHEIRVHHPDLAVCQHCGAVLSQDLVQEVVHYGGAGKGDKPFVEEKKCLSYRYFTIISVK